MTEIGTPKHWKRREEILRIIESLGTTRISKAELAKNYGVSPRQISKDFDALSDKISRFKKKELNFDAYIVFEFAMNKLLELARNENQKPMEKVKAISALVNTVDKKIDNLIKLGLIDPAEETINVRHSPESEFYEQVIKVARELRARKTKTKELCINES